MANRRRDVRSDANSMTTSCYLCICSNGALRLTATAPRLAANEVCMKLDVKVPRALFVKPMLRAEVTVPQEAGNPSIIEAKTVNEIRDAVKQATGMDLAINVVSP